MKILSAILIALIVSPVLAQQKPKTRWEPIRIYVVSAPEKSAGFIETQSDPKFLDASVKDLVKNFGKYKGLTVVSDRATADIVVEVIARGIRDSASVTTPASTIFSTPGEREPAKEYFVKAKMIAGDYVSPVEGSEKLGMFASWGDAALGVSNEVWRWANLNREKLIEKRSKQSDSQSKNSQSP